MTENRVERCGLAAAGRPREQDDALRPGDHQFELIKLRVGEAESFQRYQALLAVENAQHDVFAMHRRLRRDTEVDLPAADIECDASVLRRARFGDVHAAHHLDAHSHGRPVGLMQRADLTQDAVDTVTDAQEAALRLEVDVGCLAFDSVGEDRVDQANDWLAVLVGG